MSETIKDCKHEDCIFRSSIPKGGSCAYIMIAGKSRRCSISKCDKYISRHKATKKTKINTLYEIVWEIEQGEEK